MTYNASDAYFGTFSRFQVTNKKEGVALVSSDNAIGDIGTVVWRVDEHQKQQAWLKNRFGFEIAYLDAEISYTLAVFQAKGWVIRYVLSLIAYSEKPAPGAYWGEAAIIAYAPRYENQFDLFLTTFAQRMAEGLRPDPDLSPKTIETIILNPSSWKPTFRAKTFKTDRETVILKDHRSMHDRLLDQARKKNPGCYVISWLFIISIIVAIIYLIRLMIFS